MLENGNSPADRSRPGPCHWRGVETVFRKPALEVSISYFKLIASRIRSRLARYTPRLGWLAASASSTALA